MQQWNKDFEETSIKNSITAVECFGANFILWLICEEKTLSNADKGDITVGTKALKTQDKQ